MKNKTRMLALAASCVVALTFAGTESASARSHHATLSSAHAHHHVGKAKAKKARKPGPDARKLFATKKLPAALPTQSIGSYVKGCIAGAVNLPQDGPHWQVMRLSRNRYWGHPRLKSFLERLSDKAHKDGWNGLLVGDMGMPRGGPMPSGHASHNIGLDADIWLTPEPNRTLSKDERETMEAHSVLKTDSADLNRNVWTPGHEALVRDAAQDPDVVRIFVTPAIKEELCDHRDKSGADDKWLAKLRPCDNDGVCSGHDDHIHVRLSCTKGDAQCISQPAPEEACTGEIAANKKKIAEDPPNKSVPGPAPTPNSPLDLARMPKACIGVLNAKP